MISLNNIVRSVTRLSAAHDTEKLNILTMCNHDEKYIELLCKTGHNFFIPENTTWNNLVASKPNNIQTLNLSCEPLDFLICYNRAEQYDEAIKIARSLYLPIILVDMAGKELIRPQHIMEHVQARDKSLLNKKPILQVSCSEYIQQEWNYLDSISHIIPIGIDTEKFTNNPQYNDTIIAVDNHTIPQVGQAIEARLNKYKCMPTDHDDPTNITVNNAKYFINTNKTVTIKMLEAMSAGAVVIAFPSPDIENVITSEETGIILKDIDDLTPTLEKLEGSIDLVKNIQSNARKLIIQEHSVDNFINKWLAALHIIKPTFYTPHI